jgi:hypothetical protein
MLNPQNRSLGWLGFWSAFAGALISNFVMSEDLLPINRDLFAITSGLMLAWLLVLVTTQLRADALIWPMPTETQFRRDQ